MKKLLIVDDEPDLLYALKPMLLQHFEVGSVTSINEIIDEFNSFKPNVVLMDVWVRGKDARKICKQLRDDPANKHVTLILFSAYPSDLVDYKQYGADSVIEKPFVVKDLISNINFAMQQRELLNGL